MRGSCFGRWIRNVHQGWRKFTGGCLPINHYASSADGTLSLVFSPCAAPADAKCEFSQPRLLEEIPAGSRYQVRGSAWTSHALIDRIEFSGDGGTTWKVTELRGEALPFVWRSWNVEWIVPSQPGRVLLLSRIIGEMGDTLNHRPAGDSRRMLMREALPVEICRV